MSGTKRNVVIAVTHRAAFVVLTLLAGCSLFGDTGDEDGGSPQSDSTTVQGAIPTTVVDDTELAVDLFNDGIFCDGSDRRAAIIYGARPGETITFESPMPVEIADGVADDQGTFQLTWQCESFETALFWDITATTADSRQSVDFRVKGIYVDPTVETEMVFTPTPGFVACDGARRTVGYLAGAQPLESVTFSSPAIGSLETSKADADGRATVTWSCREEEVRTWPVRASGLTSGKSATFDIVGEPPTPQVEGPIQVELVENPFSCNRQRRPVAKLSNLTPGVQVAFEASPSNGALEPGTSNSSGSMTLYWQCDRSQGGTEWNITAAEQSLDGTDKRSASLAFTVIAPPNPTTIAFTEDPFICDGTSHEVAVLSNFVANEFIDFTSPQSDGLRQGQAGTDGSLAVRWQCTGDEVGKQWEVTATGATSGVDLTFTITGAAPAE